MQNPQQFFCNLCKYVGHDEHNFQSYELMMDKHQHIEYRWRHIFSKIKTQLQCVEDSRDEEEEEEEELEEDKARSFVTILEN